jgi:hypothetical protein
LPGPVTDRPALVALDATHLLLAAAVGMDSTDSGNVTAIQLRAAVLSTDAPGAVATFDLGPDLGPLADPTASVHGPCAARVGDDVYVGWMSVPSSGASEGEQAFVARVTLDPSQANGLASEEELRMPYPSGGGFQSNIHLAASSLFPGGALLTAWEGASDGTSRATSDVMLDVRPSPFVFLPVANDP